MSYTTSVIEVVTPARAETHDLTRWRGATRIAVSSDEPVFAGHYPGLPVLPGVAVVECVLRSAALVGPPAFTGHVLAEIESARFTGAVRPGDVLTIDLRWRPDGGDWRCTARVTGGSDEVAGVRLRFGEPS